MKKSRSKSNGLSKTPQRYTKIFQDEQPKYVSNSFVQPNTIKIQSSKVKTIP
jgi:hypothetical protein